MLACESDMHTILQEFGVQLERQGSYKLQKGKLLAKTKARCSEAHKWEDPENFPRGDTWQTWQVKDIPGRRDTYEKSVKCDMLGANVF